MIVAWPYSSWTRLHRTLCCLLLILSCLLFSCAAWSNGLAPSPLMATSTSLHEISRLKFLALLKGSCTTVVATCTLATLDEAATPNTDTSSITKQCQNGALLPEVAVPGAYNQLCMTLEERILDDSVVPKSTIRIQQKPSGSGSTGLAVWNSGLLLSRLLVAFVTTSNATKNWWSCQDIVEVGCGTGLVSIVARKLGASSVLATDGNPTVLELATSNIQQNNVEDTVSTSILSWGLLSAMDYVETADVIIGSDLTYNSGSWRVLAETMSTILKDTGVVVYLSLGHEGFNVQPEVDGFLSVAKEQGLMEISSLQGVSFSKLLNEQVLTSYEKENVVTNGARVVLLAKKQRILKS